MKIKESREFRLNNENDAENDADESVPKDEELEETSISEDIGAVPKWLSAELKIECSECFKTKLKEQGYADNIDGIWYCNDCWKAFYNNEEQNESYNQWKE